MGIRGQVFLPLVLVAVGGAIAGSFAIFRSADRSSIHELKRSANRVADGLLQGNYPFTPKVLDQVADLTGTALVYLEATGDLASSEPLSSIRKEREEFTALLNRASSNDVEVTFLERRYLVGKRIVPAASARSPGTLFVLMPKQEASVFATHWGELGLLFGSLGVSALSAGWVGHRLVSRLGRLVFQTQRIAGGDFMPMPVSVARDEVDTLARSVNSLADRLHTWNKEIIEYERLRLEEQLSRGLAHELKNIVTGAILAVGDHAEVCPADHQEARESLDLADRQVRLLQRRLRGFLLLQSEPTSAGESCDLLAIVKEVCDSFIPHARHLYLTLERDDERSLDGVRVPIRSENLRQIVSNVLSNGVEAAGQNGTVRITTRFAGDHAEIEISDNGPGPSSGNVDQMFQAFATSKPEGIGLGLSIAKRLVEQDSGTLVWRRVGEWTQFIITLPADIPAEVLAP